MYIISRLQPHEISEAKELLSYIWQDTYSSFLSQKTIDDVTLHWHAPKLLLGQSNDPTVFFGVAKAEDNKIVGLTTVKQLKNGQLMMNRLYIHPSFQRQGIGRLLFQTAIKAFPNATMVTLEVEAQNIKAQEFYKGLGFREVEQYKEKIGNNVLDSIVMELSLV